MQPLLDTQHINTLVITPLARHENKQLLSSAFLPTLHGGTSTVPVSVHRPRYPTSAQAMDYGHNSVLFVLVRRGSAKAILPRCCSGPSVPWQCMPLYVVLSAVSLHAAGASHRLRDRPPHRDPIMNELVCWQRWCRARTYPSAHDLRRDMDRPRPHPSTAAPAVTVAAATTASPADVTPPPPLVYDNSPPPPPPPPEDSAAPAIGPPIVVRPRPRADDRGAPCEAAAAPPATDLLPPLPTAPGDE